MKLIDLYNHIGNPLDEPFAVEKLINAYSESLQSFGDFNAMLFSLTPKKYVRGEYYQRDADLFYSRLFNKWKNSIVSLTDEEYINLKNVNAYDEDILELKEYLKTIADVNTMTEANKILFIKHENQVINTAMKKYRWNSFGDESTWMYVCSYFLTAKKETFPITSHQLYLNVESTDKYKLALMFINKCEENNLPYYFKLSLGMVRDDAFVIYSNFENLTKYIDLLYELERENIDFFNRILPPPILTGKINKWLGYSSEMAKTFDHQPRLYNLVRTNLITKMIADEIKEWISKNHQKQINFHRKTLSFEEIFCIYARDYFLKTLTEKYEKHIKEKKYNSIYNEKEIISELGYSLKDINSDSFIENVNLIFMQKRLILMEGIKEGKLDSIKMQVRNNMVIEYNYSDLQSTIGSIISLIMYNYPLLKQEIRDKIDLNARREGIDPKTFCFDSVIKQQIFKDEKI